MAPGESPSLDSVWLKLEWAKENLHDLEAGVEAFIKHGQTVTKEFNEKGEVVAFRPRFDAGQREPQRLSIQAGEIIHQLRSCFDHLAWRLVELNGSDPAKVTPRVEFPIYKDRARYESEGWRKIRHVSPEAQEIIGAMQPYHRGDRAHSSPLWVIHRLDIIDKHRLLLVLVVDVWQGWITSPRVLNRLGLKSFKRSVDFDGESWASVDATTNPDPELSFTVSLRESSEVALDIELLTLLRLLTHATEHMLGHFQGLFVK